MTTGKFSAPKQYAGVMVSSTFTDLIEHRKALIGAIHAQDLKAVAMEDSSAKPAGDVIDSSLKMVTDSAGYVGVISHKYGQIPKCSRRNPKGLSLTELEFNRARELDRPILLFIMDDQHSVRREDVETNSEKIRKLSAFKDSAKVASNDSSTHRVYKVFSSLEDFRASAIQAIAELSRHLSAGDAKEEDIAPKSSEGTEVFQSAIPKPPLLYAEPPYIGSHSFIGRAAQIDALNEWASLADPHPLLLFEAIGGTGKSILSWEWANRHAIVARNDWAGRFWYSFYEKGATMSDFCRRALAYMSGHPRSAFKDKGTAELIPPLMIELRSRPWLLILDGLERILVSYHRYDAAQLADDQAGQSDKIADRDPCSAINPEDEDLLRALTVAMPSKLLITSRLVPRALLNRSGQAIPGVLRERLPGLKPVDAEALARSCGVTGSSRELQDYLKSNCDCHPLVIGVLAGLITDYLPDRGNFDAWILDRHGGGNLDFANLDLVQKRNHILSAALLALPAKSRRLLTTLALLSESIDFSTLAALNPELPPIPEEVEPPEDPREQSKWNALTWTEQERWLKYFEGEQGLYAEYLKSQAMRESSMKFATPALSETIRDLERRGLLQYEKSEKRYDLHPVVRGVAASGLKNDEIRYFGQRMVDHFSQQAQNPYEAAEGLEDFDNARRIVKALFQMGKHLEARTFIKDNNFIQILNRRFEAHHEILSILRPFFSKDWSQAPLIFSANGGLSIASAAGVSLRRIEAFPEAFSLGEASILSALSRKLWGSLSSQLLSLSSTSGDQNKIAMEFRLLMLSKKVATLDDVRWGVDFALRLAMFRYYAKVGDFVKAQETYSSAARTVYSSEELAIRSHHFALFQLFQGKLDEQTLSDAEKQSADVKSALGIRNLCRLRGIWCLERSDWEGARASLGQAIALAHRANKVDRRSEIDLARAKQKLGQLMNPVQEAESLERHASGPCSKSLADLWLSVGDSERASAHALAAYEWASADGAPFCRAHDLAGVVMLLNTLGREIPAAPKYDHTLEQQRHWESLISREVDSELRRRRK